MRIVNVQVAMGTSICKIDQHQTYGKDLNVNITCPSDNYTMELWNTFHITLDTILYNIHSNVINTMFCYSR